MVNFHPNSAPHPHNTVASDALLRVLHRQLFVGFQQTDRQPLTEEDHCVFGVVKNCADDDHMNDLEIKIY